MPVRHRPNPSTGGDSWSLSPVSYRCPLASPGAQRRVVSVIRNSVRCDKETIMQAPSGQMTTPQLQALLKDGALAGDWVLDPGKSSIRLKTKIMGLVPVTGV